MAILYEYCNTGDDDASHFSGSDWFAQTFTPSVAHKITSVKLKLLRDGSPGTITVSIRGTDGSGHPTGEDLCSGTTDGNTLAEWPDSGWREITLGDGANLDADTKYAIVVRALDASAEEVYWRIAWLTDYTDGCSEWSEDSGSNWASYTNYDFMFEEWGEAILTFIPTVMIF